MPKSFLNNYYFAISKLWISNIWEVLEKDGHRKWWRSVLFFLKILDMGPISARKHEWDFSSMVPISTRKHEMDFWNLKIWIILGSIKKPWRSMLGKVGSLRGDTHKKMNNYFAWVLNNMCLRTFSKKNGNLRGWNLDESSKSRNP